jgi:hypothetical protein
MDAGQYSAAVAAIKEKGILSGKRVERSEHGARYGRMIEAETETAKIPIKKTAHVVLTMGSSSVLVRSELAS